MKVLLLGPYPPPHGGVQTNLVAIREMLLARGVPCTVINLHRHRTGRGQAVYHPTGALETLWLLLRLRCDILHLHLGGDLTPRLLGLCFACTMIPGKKAVLTFHSGGYASSPAGRSAAPDTLRGQAFRRFDRIIAVNQEIVDLFHRFGVPPDRVRLIPPHALPPRVPDVELPAGLRHFFHTHRPVLATVGLLEPEYDLPLQVRALGRVRDRHPKAGLVLVGSGSLEPHLRRMIDEQPYAEHVLLCGDVPHPTTLRAIAEADVFLRTTLYDGDSVAVREALHLGTPVIASDNRMRPPGVRLVPASDLDALCAAIEAGLASPHPRTAGSSSGEEHVQAVLDLYRELRGGGELRAATHQAVE
jgi:glycosyltransferase involved in cell wall biosynthesis